MGEVELRFDRWGYGVNTSSDACTAAINAFYHQVPVHFPFSFSGSPITRVLIMFCEWVLLLSFIEGAELWQREESDSRGGKTRRELRTG